jgi:hypothetical protein
MIEGRSTMKRGRAIDLAGMRFGILTVVALAPKPEGGQGRHWLCKCDCGAKAIKRGKDLTNGNTASCGCKKTGPGGRYRKPELDINRPWRKAEQVDDRWLVLMGERCPRAAA